jgi:hypothetical protein
MALTQAILGKTKAGDKWVSWGTWTATSVTGGDIDTGLRVCDMCFLTHTGTAVEAAVAVVNETFPGLAGNAITFVCTSGDAGLWYAIGRE